MARELHTLDRAIIWTLFACVVVVCAAFPAHMFAQAEGLFDTSPIERSVKREFRLSSRDMKVLRPLIKKEDQALVQILGECMDGSDEDYMRLWNRVRASRAEFEVERLNGLAINQREALRAARVQLETIVLNQWVDDYVEELRQYLELDWIQSNLVSKVFEDERVNRMKLLSGQAVKKSEIDSKWQELSEKREKSLEMILSPEQLRDYLSMTKRIERLVG